MRPVVPIRMLVVLVSTCGAFWVATLSAHVVKGRLAPGAATAFVSSPSAGTDPLIPYTAGVAAQQPPILTPAFRLSAASVSPVAVRLTWTPVPGATSFVLARDGQEIAKGPRLLEYVDSTVAPDTGYTYTVTVSAPPNPLRPTPPPAALAKVVTPKVVSPPGVLAKITGVGTIELSWNPTPGITSYVISRNGRPLRVSSKDALGLYMDRNLPPDGYRYTIRSVVRTANRQEYQGDESPAITVHTRPFNVLAVGDSIMWGQGLRPSSKFVSKVQSSLRELVAKDVNLFLLAHSGAEMTPIGELGREPRLAGEVPSAFPSTPRQALVLGPAVVNPTHVDLVLVNGCINDVGVTTILDPRVGEAELASKTREKCDDAMRRLLPEIASTYPEAAILVVGYFPIVSVQSDLTAVALLATSVGALSAAVAPSVGIPIDPVTGTVAGIVTSLWLRERFIANSTTFYAVSTNVLRQAVLDFNAASGRAAARFVEMTIGAEHAYAAPVTHLWLIPTPPLVKDEVFDERKRACGAIPNASPTCGPASMGHPNVRGAQAYADAITANWSGYVEGWRTRHAAAQFVR